MRKFLCEGSEEQTHYGANSILAKKLMRLFEMIYSLLDKNGKAKEQVEKYKELLPKKFEVDRYLIRTPLSKMKILGSNKS